MDLPGSAYLYTVATVSVTFVGFSALAMLCRQPVGTGITSYDSFFTIIFMQTGFMVTAGALLPPLLALYELSPDFVWRWSSAITAIPIFLFVFTFPGRRRKATSRSASAFVWMLLLLQLISGLYLVFNAIGNPVRTGGAAYAVAMTAMLFTSVLAYLLALADLFQPPANSSSPVD
jgi:hypothetical protein